MDKVCMAQLASFERVVHAQLTYMMQVQAGAGGAPAAPAVLGAAPAAPAAPGVLAVPGAAPAAPGVLAIPAAPAAPGVLAVPGAAPAAPATPMLGNLVMAALWGAFLVLLLQQGLQLVIRQG